jgi:hypothetical protein
MGIRKFICAAFLLLTLGVKGQEALVHERSDSNVERSTWVIALPFEMVQDSNALGLPGSFVFTNRMATQFYTGLRAGVDSLNHAGANIHLILVDHDEAQDVYKIEHENADYTWFVRLDPEAFMRQCERWNVDKIIGPFRGEASEVLASHSTGIQVINPLSRKVDVAGKPYLVAAASYRMAEVERLGERAAQAKQMAPRSKTLLLRTDASSAGAESVFMQAYIKAGGKAEDVQIQEYRQSAVLPVSVASMTGLTRIILLDDKVLIAARVLNQLRPFEPSRTEFWTLGNVLSSSALDAQLLMRQPLIWTQVERLDYIQFRSLDALLYSAAKTTPGRWEWLGLDMAWLAQYIGNQYPNGFEGPRRLYVWDHAEGSGFRNHAALIFRYDRTHGIQAEWTPTIEYGEEESMEEIVPLPLDSLFTPAVHLEEIN